MRFKTQYELKDREGEKKIVRKFLWFPCAFNDDKEHRWLETADVVYRVQRVYTFLNFVFSTGSGWKWRPIRFANHEDYQGMPLEKPYGDFEEMVEKRVAKPSFWLILDSLALLVAFFDMKDAITLLLTIKVIQAFALSFPFSENKS
jgi:hypothetical protein